jgi:hypothetical protein
LYNSCTVAQQFMHIILQNPTKDAFSSFLHACFILRDARRLQLQAALNDADA